MIKSLESGKAHKDSLLMLNITGGGEKRFKNDFNLVSLKPHKIISNHSELSEIVKEAELLFD